MEKIEKEEGQAQAALLQTEISIVESRRRAQELQQQVVKLAEDMKVRAHSDAAVTCLAATEHVSRRLGQQKACRPGLCTLSSSCICTG